MDEVFVVDTTLRDAHQSLWATRMTTAMMLSVAERMDRVGFDAIDLPGAGAHIDVAVRYLKENPWDKIRLLCEKIRHTPLSATVRAKTGAGFDIVPSDIPLMWIDRLIAHGVRRFWAHDPLGHLDNIVYLLKHAKELGAYTIGTVDYGHSPVHTDAFYQSITRQLVDRAQVDAIKIKDPGGLLTPERIRTLVPAMKKVMGELPLHLHTHCLTGLGPLVYLEGVQCGARHIETSIAPLANGEAQPATQTIARNLRDMGYAVKVDDSLVDEIGEHLRKIAKQEGLPLGAPKEYDAFHFEHQVPGGMQTNFKFQLAQAGLTHKLDELLHECARIRAELGWPIMITPFAQFVGTLAVLNIVHGERYKIIPDEVKKYALGYYGNLMAPIAPDVLDRIMSNGSPKIALIPPEPEPAMPGLRKKYPNISDEERLLRYSFAGSQVDDMLAAGAIRTDYTIDQPWIRLLQEVAKRPRLARVYIKKQGFLIDLVRKDRRAVPEICPPGPNAEYEA